MAPPRENRLQHHLHQPSPRDWLSAGTTRIHACAALLIALGAIASPIAAQTTQLSQTSWRFYDNTTPDGAMAPLAAVDTAATLGSTFIQNGTIRLRVLLAETGGLGDVDKAATLQFSADQTTWTNIAPQSSSSGEPFLYVNGAAINGNFLGSLLLPAGNALGHYHETGNVLESIAAFEPGLELDFAIKCHWPATGNWYFRVAWNGAGVPPTAAGYPQVTITADNRTHVVTSVGNLFGGEGLSEELRVGDYKRLWYDGSRYWIFYTVADSATPTMLFYRHWSGSGAWSPPVGLPCSDETNNGRHRPWVENIGGTHTVFLLLGDNEGTSSRYLRRGTINGATIVWDAEQSITANFGDEANAIGVDDGDYVWLAGVANSGGTVWARRSTNPDSVSSFLPARTVADQGASDNHSCHVIGLGGSTALVLWYKDSLTDVRHAVVSEPAGFGPVASVNTAGCQDQDWGFTVDKQNGFVYLVHTDSTINGAGNLVLRVFDIATGTWSTGTAPPSGVGNRPFGGDDHAPIQLIGNDLYVFFTLADGGEDRAVAYHKYTGPGASGSWSSSATALSDSGRCNLDRIVTVGPGTPADRILAVVAAGDNPNHSSPIDLEWWDEPLGPTATFAPFGTGCLGSGGVPSLTAPPGERPILGQDLDLQFTSLAPFPINPVFATLGFSNTVWPPFSLPLPLAVLGMPGCNAYVSLEIWALLTSVNGACNWTIPIPNHQSLAGVRFYVQGLVPDVDVNPLGLVTTNGGAGRIGTQ
ncbi:MAG TPA: hypothetical protein VF384_13425 [Planctomycetota bacterium]